MSTYSLLFLALNGPSCSSLIERLRCEGIALIDGQSIERVQKELQTKKYPVLVNTCDTVGDAQLALLRFIKEHDLPTRMIVSATSGTVEHAVRLMKAGAADFMVSEVPNLRLVHSILQNLAQYKQLFGESGRDALPQHGSLLDTLLVGQSPAICEIRSAIKLAAKSKAPVLITGESGTGKEVIARQLHLHSNRAEKPYIALNCAALPKDVIENELFGHERGAFSGALAKKEGCFELADRGTLFFDEIAEMSPDTQAKLLRAIELKSFRRLGGKDEVNVDVRAIAATNKNITKTLKSGEFREDLYYRLSVIEIFIPPLRERKEDIPPLVEHFLNDLSGKYGKPRQQFSDESLDFMTGFDWPGNVRELRNVIERSIITCSDETISPGYLPHRVTLQPPVVPSSPSINIPVGSSTQEAEGMLILQTLASVGNNKSVAAKILGFSRKTLHNKLRSLPQLNGGAVSQLAGISQ